jgi:dolichyl-phosphate beta-glucosyltransferase
LNSTKYTCISIIIPVYNEQNRISKTLTTLTDYLSSQDYSWEIVIVDDGSQDNTINELNAHLEDSRIKLIGLQHNGKGSAIKQGMLSASGKIRMMCDADMAMPVKYIADFISEIHNNQTDVVIGSRQISGSKRFNESNFRHLIGRIYNFWIKLFLISDYLDTQCGFKAFTDHSAKQIFSLQQLEGFGFDVEILVIARLKELKTKELPIEWYHDEESKVNPILDSLRMFLDTIKIKVGVYIGKYNH